MPEIIHYQDPQSRAMRTQRLLDAFDIPHTSVLVELRKGDNKNPDYAAIHPYQRVPALKYGDVTIVESGAIQLFLADVFAEKMNTPKLCTPERARLYEWLFFLQTTLEPLAVQAYDPAKKDASKVQIRDLLHRMAVKFVGPFVLGEQFSVADVIVHSDLSWYQIMDLYPHELEPYDGFMKRMAERAQAQA